MTARITETAKELAASGQLPAFVYDLAALQEHAARVRRALDIPGGPEIYYAAKANPDSPILRTIAPYVDGIEVASGGELEHVRRTLPTARLAFGGPGKVDWELKAALAANVDRVHVESPRELSRLSEIARAADREIDVLLRLNLAGDRDGAALAMAGPFGMDPDLIAACDDILAASPWVRCRGIHAHLASGCSVGAMLEQSKEILAWARPWAAKRGLAPIEVNLGGGMAVNYATPGDRFDWVRYGQGIAGLAEQGEQLRIEPGRAMSVYAGAYVTDVLDIKRAHGESYAVLRGGTMHLRTPVTRQHDQPFYVIDGGGSQEIECAPVTLVGQLCTPKDVFARRASVNRLAVGDIVVFEMAGAYAWNISHHDFLMHPQPTFHYL
jgi:diaminopimelate decarboxylase